MGVSHEICKKGFLEFAVDVEKHDDLIGCDPEIDLAFSITMGTGFNSVGQSSVNIEIPRLSLEEFRAVVDRMKEVLAEYA